MTATILRSWGGSMRSVILLALLLVVVAAIAYWPVSHHDFVNFDDNGYVYQNPHVTTGLTGANVAWAFTAVHQANWHPLTWLSHMADVEMFGLRPRGHHLTNVGIHCASTLLLFLLLFRSTGARWRSAFVAALFALHPLHVESVAWVAERKDVLSAFFWFLTLLVYVEYVARQKRVLYLLALLTFALGLMAKPMLVTLPVILLLLDIWPLDRGRLNEPGREGGRRFADFAALPALVKEKIPFFACSLISSAITIYAQGSGGSIQSIERIPLALRLANAVTAYVKYIGKMFWPVDLAVYYPLPPSVPLWQVAGSLLVLLAMTVITLRAAARHPYLAVGWCWFLVTLLPVIGIIQVGGQSMADRYTYIPLTGLFVAVAWGVPALADKFPGRQVVMALLASSAVISSLLLTRQQLTYWQDSIALTRHAISVTANNCMMHALLGSALMEKNSVDEAIEEYRKALAINPAISEVHLHLGIALAEKGQVDQAVEQYRQAVVLDPANSLAYINLGTALAEQNQFEQAVQQYRKAIELDPANSLAYDNLGRVLAKAGRLPEAIAQYRKAIGLEPNKASAYINLGLALVEQGRLDEAITLYQEAVATYPGNIELRNDYGRALAGQGLPDLAIEQYRKAIELNPTEVNAHYNLGIALGLKGEADAAIAAYRQVITLDPDHIDARNNLGIAFDHKGRIDEAIAEFQQVVRLDPRHVLAYNNLGIAFAKKGLFTQSVNAFQQALAIAPDYADARKNLGIVLQMQKQAGKNR